jgi:TonB-dependent receptor
MNKKTCAFALATVLGSATYAAEPTAANAEDELAEVVVVGTRAALVESRDLKKSAGIVQDSIVAEDLGRFPDANVADSLSHITGVSISRTRGGEGQYVSVRGLGPGYSIVTLNGRILATDGDGREFAFDVLPSEVISGADVYKSSDAAQLEGSIGGTVNLSSAKPLSNPGRHLNLSVDGDYNDLSEDNGFKVSGVFGNTFAGETVGVLLTATYQDTTDRSDAVQEFSINPDSPGEFDANDDGEISDDESALLGLCCTSFGARIQKKERIGVTGVLQWKPSESFSTSFDALFTRLDAPTVGYHESFYVEDSILDEETGLHRWSDVTIRDHWVTGMTVAELVPELSTITEYRVVDTTQFGWNARWQPSEKLTLDFDAYRSESTRDSGGKDTWVVSGIGGNHTGRVDMNNHGIPDISVTLEDGRDLATALAAGELGDADYGLHYIGLSGTDVNDRVTGFTVSGSLEFGDGPFKSLAFGAARTERGKTRNTVENDTNGGSCQYCNMYTTTFESLGASVVRPVSLPNFMRNAGGDVPRTFVRFDVPAYLQARRVRRVEHAARAQSRAVLRRRGRHQRLLRACRPGRGSLVRQRRPAFRLHRHDRSHGDQQHPVRRRPDARGPDLEPRCHLQRGGPAHRARQLSQGAAVVQRRLLAARRPGAADRRGASHGAPFAEPARADAHRQHAGSHLPHLV